MLISSCYSIAYLLIHGEAAYFICCEDNKILSCKVPSTSTSIVKPVLEMEGTSGNLMANEKRLFVMKYMYLFVRV